jgi:hypothetical protein
MQMPVAAKLRETVTVAIAEGSTNVKMPEWLLACHHLNAGW